MHVSELGMRRHLVLSRRLRERRRGLGLTQKEVVARLRGLGVVTTNKALSSLEHGAGLDVAKLPELACALECTLTYLVGLTDDPRCWTPERGQWPDAPARRPAPGPRVRAAPPPATATPPILGPLTDR